MERDGFVHVYTFTLTSLVDHLHRTTTSLYRSLYLGPKLLHMQYRCNDIVVAEMEMGNIVPRVGLEPTSRAFMASVLPLGQVGSLISPLYPCLPVYAAHCLRSMGRPLHSSPWSCKSFIAYNYIHTRNGHIYTYTG